MAQCLRLILRNFPQIENIAQSGDWSTVLLELCISLKTRSSQNKHGRSFREHFGRTVRTLRTFRIVQTLRTFKKLELSKRLEFSKYQNHPNSQNLQNFRILRILQPIETQNSTEFATSNFSNNVNIFTKVFINF